MDEENQQLPDGLSNEPLPVEQSSFLNSELFTQGMAAFSALAKLTPTALSGHYYTEECALFAKDILDKLHTNLSPIKVTADGYSLGTIRIRYNQGKKYLLDRLDPIGKYAELAALTKCSLETASGCIMFFPRRKRFISAPVVVTKPDWQNQFQDFLDTAVHGDKFSEPSILLSDAELLWIEAQLVSVADLFVNLSGHEKILVLRIDKERLVTTEPMI